MPEQEYSEACEGDQWLSQVDKDIMKIPNSCGVDSSTQRSLSGLSNGKCRASSQNSVEPPTKFQDQPQKVRSFQSADVVKEVSPEIDPEIDSDTEIMCMIFQASEQSKPEFDVFNTLTVNNVGSFDPIRRTSSMEPPVTSKLKKIFSRARTMP